MLTTTEEENHSAPAEAPRTTLAGILPIEFERGFCSLVVICPTCSAPLPPDNIFVLSRFDSQKSVALQLELHCSSCDVGPQKAGLRIADDGKILMQLADSQWIAGDRKVIPAPGIINKIVHYLTRFLWLFLPFRPQ